jgi:hypothetical protein
MSRHNFNSLFRLAMAALWAGLAAELFWAVIVTILGMFYIWGFSTGRLTLDPDTLKKNYQEYVLPYFGWLPIAVAIFGCIFWYELVQCAVCAGHPQAEELNMFLPLVALLGYFWGRIPVTVSRHIMDLFDVIKFVFNCVRFLKQEDSKVDFSLGVPLSPPRFFLA